jgi:murein DD-endopeptidase MepM/ murein hydrolase activator NlpD
MQKASLAAAFAASLLFGSMSAAVAADNDNANLADARVAQERLLGSADEDARYLACQPFTRQIAAGGIISQSFDASVAGAGVPAAAMLEARRAFATSIDLGDVAAGDGFYVRYEQAFTAEGTPIGVGRVMWAELRTKAKGTTALHRFRPQGGVERLWLASGEAATTPSMSLPLDAVTVSSGFGLRADPLDKPSAMPLAMGPLPDPAKSVPAAYVEVPVSEQSAVAPREEPVKPARRQIHGGFFPGQPGFAGFSMNSHPALDGTDLQRVVAVRDAEARRAAAARPVDVPSDTAAQPPQVAVAVGAPAPRVVRRPLFMHDGADLVAPTGTPVYAAADGVVIGAAPNGGYGNWIRIDHQGKLSTVYGHLSSFAPGIQEGARVSQGELIGFVGNTGRSTGSHLHFEILSNGKAVDPLAYPDLKRAQLRGADLERFRKQVKNALAEREREKAITLAFDGF